MNDRSALAWLFVVGGLAGCGGPPAAVPSSSTVPAAEVANVPAPPSHAGDAVKSVADGSLGQLDFSVTGSPECQMKFREGMLALHSFLYDQAHVNFSAALAVDSACAMAAWGDAMAYEHPVWGEHDQAKGRFALARIHGEDTLTPKERRYIGAARALYGVDNVKDARSAWLVATAAMHRDFPDDDEVTLQHVLALLAAYAYDDQHVREQMEAGGLALSVLQHRADHPGALHYVIHAFDSREHAILALPAARAYARVAPTAGHAQHMPSHIFTHLGMWREVVPSNEKAYAASVAWEKSQGHTPSKYDWHSYSWLVAAHLELGHPTQARQLVDDAGALLTAAKDDSASFRGGYIDMTAAYVTQTERWGEAEALVAPVLAPLEDEGASGSNGGCAMHAPGAGGETRPPIGLFARLVAHMLRAEAAIHLADEATVVKRVADMKAVRVQMAPWDKMLSPAFAKRWDAKAEALLARAHAAARPSIASQKKAIDALEHLAGLETSGGGSGPAWERSPREQLAEMFLAAGNAKEALSRFEAELDRRPNRALALLGAARAAKAVGDGARTRAHYAALAELWSDADTALPALAEARAGAR